MASPKVPASGVWCPAVTFFNSSTDRLIPEDQAKYYTYLASTGLSGLVVLGTNAETFLLTRDERRQLLEIARAAVGPSFPIMAGVGGHSTRQVLEHVDDAAAAGADYVLVLPPAYFRAATTAAVIDGFFADVAAHSPLPLVLYNFPGVCNGVDLDSPTIARLAKQHNNIVGVKLTCGSVAKITRLAAELPPDRFAVFGGQSDFLLGGLAVGSAGCIAAFANVAPKAIVNIYRLWKDARWPHDALSLHQRAALAEQACKGGIAAVKYGAAIFSARAAGVEDPEDKMKPRRPYLPLGDEVKRDMREALEEILAVEANL